VLRPGIRDEHKVPDFRAAVLILGHGSCSRDLVHGDLASGDPVPQGYVRGPCVPVRYSGTTLIIAKYLWGYLI